MSTEREREGGRERNAQICLHTKKEREKKKEIAHIYEHKE